MTRWIKYTCLYKGGKYSDIIPHIDGESVTDEIDRAIEQWSGVSVNADMRIGFQVFQSDQLSEEDKKMIILKYADLIKQHQLTINYWRGLIRSLSCM